jgi:hypothetical protein
MATKEIPTTYTGASTAMLAIAFVPMAFILFWTIIKEDLAKHGVIVALRTVPSIDWVKENKELEEWRKSDHYSTMLSSHFPSCIMLK